MPAHQLLDAAAVPGPRRPCPAITPAGSHRTSRRYPADRPTVDEIVAVMRQAGDTRHGRRMRGLIVVLWRAGVRIHEALTLAETDLNERRGSLLIRHGKGDRRREVGMDPWDLGPGRLDRGPRRPPAGRAVLRDRRADPRPRVVRHRSACGAASPCR